MPVDAPAQAGEIDLIHARHIAVLIEELPRGVDLVDARVVAVTAGLVGAVDIRSLVVGGRGARHTSVDLQGLFVLGVVDRHDELSLILCRSAARKGKEGKRNKMSLLFTPVYQTRKRWAEMSQKGANLARGSKAAIVVPPRVVAASLPHFALFLQVATIAISLDGGGMEKREIGKGMTQEPSQNRWDGRVLLFV